VRGDQESGESYPAEKFQARAGGPCDVEVVPITSTSATRTGSPVSWCRDWRKGAYLLLLRDTQDVVLPAGIAVDWLHGAGLDGTVKARGLAVLTEADPVLDLPRRDERVRVFRPISENSAPTDDSVAAR
jgi:hypothetical protein